MSITICVATYGEERWKQLAASRAIPSAQQQFVKYGDLWANVEVVSSHEGSGTVSSSRNTAATFAHGDWLCFLDADDELTPGFSEAMRLAISREQLSAPVVFTPAVSYVRGHRRTPPKFWPECEPHAGNWLVIGTLVPRDLFFEVGGFVDYGDPPGSNAYEDWALWARCQMAGAVVVKVPEAVYIAHQERTSRHRNVPHQTKIAWHREIECDLWPERCV